MVSLGSMRTFLPRTAGASAPTHGRTRAASVHILLLFAGVLLIFSPGGARAQCMNPPAGRVGWWRAQGDGRDSAGAKHGTLSGVGFAAGQFGQAFNFTADAQVVRIPASSSLDVGSGPGFTIESWIKPNDTATEHPIVEWGDGNGNGT